MKINLYHGSRKYFEEPDLSKARDYKDFGRGFYLTTNIDQASNWAIKGLRENNISDFGYLYQYEFEMDDAKKLNGLELTTYNKEWVDTVAWYRNNLETNMKYELIYDRMADGHYSELIKVLQKYYRKRATVDEVLAIAEFSDAKKDQYCFKTSNALSVIFRTSYAEIYNYRGKAKVIGWHKTKKGGIENE